MIARVIFSASSFAALQGSLGADALRAVAVAPENGMPGLQKIEHQRTFEKQGEIVDSNKDLDKRIAKLQKAITDLEFQQECSRIFFDSKRCAAVVPVDKAQLKSMTKFKKQVVCSQCGRSPEKGESIDDWHINKYTEKIDLVCTNCYTVSESEVHDEENTIV